MSLRSTTARIRSLFSSESPPTAAQLGELENQVFQERLSTERKLAEFRAARRELLVTGVDAELESIDQEIELTVRRVEALRAREEEISRRRRLTEEKERISRIPELIRAVEAACDPLDSLEAEYRGAVGRAQAAISELTTTWFHVQNRDPGRLHDMPQIDAATKGRVSRHLPSSITLPQHPGPRPPRGTAPATFLGDGRWRLAGAWRRADYAAFTQAQRPREIERDASFRITDPVKFTS